MYRRPGITGLTPQSSLCFAKRLYNSGSRVTHFNAALSLSPTTTRISSRGPALSRKGEARFVPPAVDRSREFSSRSTQVRGSPTPSLPCSLVAPNSPSGAQRSNRSGSLVSAVPPHFRLRTDVWILSFIPSLPTRRSVIRLNQGAGTLSALRLSSLRPSSQPLLTSQGMPGASSHRTQIG